MIFAVFDPWTLTVCINCSFLLVISSNSICKYLWHIIWSFDPLFLYAFICCFALYYSSYSIVVNLVLVYSRLMPVLICVLSLVANGSLCSYIHCVSKTSHLWFAIILTHVIWTYCVFSRRRPFTVPPQIICTSALPGKTGKQENRIFHSNAVSVHCQSSTSRSLISSVFLTRDSYSRCLLYDSLNLVTNAFSSGLMGAWFRRKEVKSAAAVGLSYMHNAYAPMRCLPERKKCHLWCVWHLLRLPDIPLILSIDFHFRLDEEQFPSFTQRPTPWKTW